MAKTSEKRLTKIKATSYANLQGTFASIIGLGVAIMHSIDSVTRVAEATDSVLRGMAFGLAAGIVSIIVLPIIYFAIFWVFGIVQAWIYNVVLGAAGGLEITVEDN